MDLEIKILTLNFNVNCNLNLNLNLNFLKLNGYGSSPCVIIGTRDYVRYHGYGWSFIWMNKVGARWIQRRINILRDIGIGIGSATVVVGG